MRIIHGNWREELLKTNLKRKAKLRIICPFIKEQTIRDIVKTCRPSEIQIITRFNLNDCYEGVSDLSALKFLLDKDATIQGIKGLHSKLYIYGESKAIITSANLTQAGLNSNHEFGCAVTDQTLIDSCNEYFDKLWANGSNNLTNEKLLAWMSEVENIKLSGGKNSGPKKPKLKDHGRKANDIAPNPNVPSFDFDAFSSQRTRRRKFNQAFVKMLGKSDDREPLDYPVLDELKRSGSYWSLGYPNSQRPRQPKDGDIMFLGRLTKGPNGHDIAIFGRAVAMQHVDERDVASADDKAAPLQDWRNTWDKYIRVYDGEFVAGVIGNGVLLSELMDTLEHNSFLPTQRNRKAKKGNLNPRLSFMQSPSVQLSEEGFYWLSDRLEQQFDLFGKTPIERYKDFYWPTVAGYQRAVTASFIMQPTYFNKGFFNLSVSTNPYLKMGEERGELVSAKTGEKIWINIRREESINKSTAARIRGNAPLRDYFQKHYQVGDEVKLEILDHKNLRLV